MKDIRKMSDKELYLLTFNDEYFYNEIKNNIFYFFALIKEEFIFNKSQLEYLLEQLKEYFIENSFNNMYFERI